MADAEGAAKVRPEWRPSPPPAFEHSASRRACLEGFLTKMQATRLFTGENFLSRETTFDDELPLAVVIVIEQLRTIGFDTSRRLFQEVVRWLHHTNRHRPGRSENFCIIYHRL